MIRLACGCTLERHPSGARHSTAKCKTHARKMRAPFDLEEAYYRELGLLSNPGLHAGQFDEILGPIERPRNYKSALEIGCGLSPYAGMIEDAGWAYFGVDPSGWAVDEMRLRGHTVFRDDWEVMGEHVGFGLILCAHALEHMKDAPRALDKIGRTLVPGGFFYLIIPDDSDLVNPDHLWFFTEQSLWKCIQGAGMSIEYSCVRKLVAREKFIYVKARKI